MSFKMTLVKENDHSELSAGDEFTLRDGEVVILSGWRQPHRIGTQGRVHVKCKGSLQEREYYASVIGAKFITEDGLSVAAGFIREMLVADGATVGARDSKLCVGQEGQFMVSLPIESNGKSAGSWTVVGDNLEHLLDRAYDYSYAGADLVIL